MSVVADEDGVVAEALELLEIAELARGVEDAAQSALFSPAEWAYARSKADPERRLAARLAAKRAAARALGAPVEPRDVEVVASRGGPPGLRLSARAQARLAELGAARALVSLTHGVSHAAALVLLLRRA